MTNNLNNLTFKEEVPPLDAVTKSEIKKSIILRTRSEATHIFVLAFYPATDKLTAIVYKEKSTPIACYTYDAKFGQYYVECSDYLDLGIIPISFSIKVDKISRWECRIPLTESIIKKYLDKQQLENLLNFKEKHKGCRFEFMQLVSCY